MPDASIECHLEVTVPGREEKLNLWLGYIPRTNEWIRIRFFRTIPREKRRPVTVELWVTKVTRISHLYGKSATESEWSGSASGMKYLETVVSATLMTGSPETQYFLEFYKKNFRDFQEPRLS